MGICNGFQILTEANLLEGALIHNASMNFICKNVFIRPATKNTILTQNLEDKAFQIPIAHGEGNFYCNAETLQRIEDGDRVLFRYCDSQGNVTSETNPINFLFRSNHIKLLFSVPFCFFGRVSNDHSECIIGR